MILKHLLMVNFIITLVILKNLQLNHVYFLILKINQNMVMIQVSFFQEHLILVMHLIEMNF